MERSNQTWLEDLKSEGSRQQAALGDLRQILLRGLRKGLSGYPKVGDDFLEDAAQEALLRVLARLTQFQGRSRFTTWAVAIAIRQALNELRRSRWRDISLEEFVGGPGELLSTSFLLEAPEGDRRSAQRALLSKLYEVMRSRLTERQRRALLAELRGMPQAEIARHLGSNTNALYKLTHDARRRLKDGLEAAGFYVGDVRAAFSP